MRLTWRYEMKSWVKWGSFKEKLKRAWRENNWFEIEIENRSNEVKDRIWKWKSSN